MSEEWPSGKEHSACIPADQHPHHGTTACVNIRVLAANDNGPTPKQVRVTFKPTTEPALESAAEVFLQLLDRLPASNDN